MGFNIDLKTMFLCLILGNFFIIVLIMSYKFHGEKNAAINVFVTSKIFRLTAWIMLGMRNIIPDFFSIAVGNSILLVGTSFESLVILMLVNVVSKNIKKVYIIITIVSVAIFNYIFFFNNSDNLRIATTFMASAIYIFMCAFGLLKAKKKTLLQQVFGFLYCILAIEFIFQVYIALIVFPSIKLFTANTYTSLSFVAVYISMIVADTGFVLLAKQNSDFELIRLANFDELTNIYNRRAFILNAEKSLALFVKKKEPISFILIDLDKFKLINDTFGHGTGDSVLMDFSSKVKMQLKSNDLFGRYGGDEFAIMLPGADSITSNEVAERLRKVIEENSIIENMDMKYTISIGLITLIPDRETNVDFLFKLSDQSLYEAKQNGRNAIVRGNKPEKLSNKNL